MKLMEITEERWDDVMNLNLKSVLFCTQAVAASMMERKSGSIINLTSIAGRNGGGPGAMLYSSAKGGLITLTKGLAKELAPYGIRVNSVAPGVIDTPFHEVFSTAEMIKNFIAGIPMARLGTPEETAKVARFFARVGLPAHLGQLSLDLKDSGAMNTLIEGTMAWPFTSNMPFAVDAEMIRRALQGAHEIALSAVAEIGDAAYRRLHAD